MQNSLNRNRMSRTSRISRIKHTTTPRHRILESEFLPWYGYQNLGHLVKSPKIGYYEESSESTAAHHTFKPVKFNAGLNGQEQISASTTIGIISTYPH